MSAKALSVAAELQNDLSRRFATVSAVTFDTDGGALIRVGTAGAGNQTALVKVVDIAPLGSDAIGLAARNYGNPLVIQVVLETSSIANVALMTEANKVALLGAAFHRGSRVELYMSANGNATGPEDIVSGNLKATFEPEQKYKTMSSI